MGGDLTVENWGQALAAIRGLDYGADVRVPKTAEPTLPRTVELRPSNFPWSIHKGATRVYREDAPGDHLQIREYPDYWSVQRDQFNPHYRPVKHAGSDIPATTAALSVATFPVFTALNGLDLAGKLGAQATDLSFALLADGVVPVFNAIFR